jgi:hypothetical protein
MPTKKEPNPNATSAPGEVAVPKKTTRTKKAAPTPTAEATEPHATVEVSIPLEKPKRGRKSASTVAEPTHTPTPEPLPTVHVTHENIQLRAYFIGENRRMFGHDGDPKQDWLEAERQLHSESRSIEAALRNH